ncbi:hypothetical protein SAMN05444920_14427 [Nonomuraea solani]|uniref:Uncharacterized protein n=1 Tax=Nonomuraea solani TaxID=1144553 RepID=A0A1H6F0V1_9ACTN|nr:hypothetical protein SAMN05444920_14427 [Nonomuraea solani]
METRQFVWTPRACVGPWGSVPGPVLDTMDVTIVNVVVIIALTVLRKERS